MDEISESEETNLYNQELHKKGATSAIVKLETEDGNMSGHKECFNYIVNDMADPGIFICF